MDITTALILLIAMALTAVVTAYVMRASTKTEARMRDTFQALAAEALHTNRGAFLDVAQEKLSGLQRDAAVDLASRQKAIDELVQPLLKTLKDVDVKLAGAERDRIAAYARLAEQVTALSDSTHTLSRALRTPAVRGRWGEMQLRRVVELAGMLQRCDFDEQPGLAGESGRLRPDMIVHLPGGKQIVVDAKTPLDAFLDAQEARDDETRAQKLVAHARQVRDHVDKLAAKSYWEPLGASPELVVLFLPGETLFSAALQHDLTLIEYGLQQRVLLASPITLIALLTTIAHSWRQEALAENSREVARLGREFYERLATFAGYLEDLRKRLDGAVQMYNQAVGSFESRVLVSARRLRDLNVTTKEEIPPAEVIDTIPRTLSQWGRESFNEDTGDPAQEVRDDATAPGAATTPAPGEPTAEPDDRVPERRHDQARPAEPTRDRGHDTGTRGESVAEPGRAARTPTDGSDETWNLKPGI